MRHAHSPVPAQAVKRPAPAKAAPDVSDDEVDDDDAEEASSEEDAFDARHRRVMAETRAKPAALRPSTQVCSC